MKIIDINPGKLLVDIAHATFQKIRNRPKAVARRAAKKAKRGETLTEDEFELLQTYKERPMAIDLGTRTSTNAMVGGGILAQVYVQAVTLIPGDGALEALLLQPESIAFFAVLLAAVIARFTKTPDQPGKL